jgi:hypothetical protein
MARYSVNPREVGIAPDERGWIPLAQARAMLEGQTAFDRGEHRPVPGERFVPLDADILWAALLSLENAEEFVAATRRLEWRFPLRGWDNVDAVMRFGPGVLPWVERLLTQGGWPAPFQASLETMLIACGPAAAMAVVRTRRPGDADPDGLGFAADWLRAHGAEAWKALAAAASTDAQMKAALDAFTRRSPQAARAALGEQAVPATVGLDAATILKVLDAAAAADGNERTPWPTLNPGTAPFEFHAMRLIAVRAVDGDDWGILLEVAQGDLMDDDARWPACVQQYTYGSQVATGGRYLTDSRPLKVTAAVNAALAKELDLRPGMSLTGDVDGWDEVLAIRATLAQDKARIFPDPQTLISVLNVPNAQVLVVSDAFEHVGGTGVGADRAPSTSVAYRTLAEAIATRDPKRFDPGTSRTDWRLHATQQQPFSWPS